MPGDIRAFREDWCDINGVELSRVVQVDATQVQLLLFPKCLFVTEPKETLSIVWHLISFITLVKLLIKGSILWFYLICYYSTFLFYSELIKNIVLLVLIVVFIFFSIPKLLSVLYDCQKTIKLLSPQSCLNSLPPRPVEKALLTVYSVLETFILVYLILHLYVQPLFCEQTFQLSKQSEAYENSHDFSCYTWGPIVIQKMDNNACSG